MLSLKDIISKEKEIVKVLGVKGYQELVQEAMNSDIQYKSLSRGNGTMNVTAFTYEEAQEELNAERQFRKYGTLHPEFEENLKKAEEQLVKWISQGIKVDKLQQAGIELKKVGE